MKLEPEDCVMLINIINQSKFSGADCEAVALLKDKLAAIGSDMPNLVDFPEHPGGSA